MGSDLKDIYEWQIEAIRESVRHADAGQLTPHEEVKKEWEAKLVEILLRE